MTAHHATVVITALDQSAADDTWSLCYRVTNSGSRRIWVNDDGFLRYVRSGKQVVLSLARAPLQPSVQPEGYFAPVMVALDPGEQLDRQLELAWPLGLSALWNDTPEAHLPPGDYLVAVEIGFATTPSPLVPRLGEPIDAGIASWQLRERSAPVPVSRP